MASSAPALQASRKALRHHRVELRAGAALHLLDCRGDRERASIRSHRGHGVERVGDCEQTRLFGNVLAGATGGIPAAVPALVVVQHVGQRFLSGPDGPDQPRARGGMLSDLCDLVGLEGTALVEDPSPRSSPCRGRAADRRAPVSGAGHRPSPSTRRRARRAGSRGCSAPPSRGHARRALRRVRSASA